MITNKTKVRKCRGRQRKGAAAVEAAIILPVLIILTLGSIDMAQYITASQRVTNACREGARMAAKAKTEDSSEIKEVVTDYLAASYPKFSGEMEQLVKVAVFNENGKQVDGSVKASVESGDQLEIVIKFNFKEIRWLPGPKYSANNEFLSSTFCRRE